MSFGPTKSAPPEGTIIIGAVVVVDSSEDVCAGASGRSTGGLGDFGFVSDLSPLRSLSYLLHKEFADKFGGREKWGFSDLEIYRVSPKNVSGDLSPPVSWGPAPPVEKIVSDLPNWVNTSDDWKVQSLAAAPHAAHVNPRKICRFLHERCEELGVQFHLSSEVTSFRKKDQMHAFTSVTIKVHEKSLAVILFPLRINSINSAGNHATVRNPRWKPSDDENGVSQVFLNNFLQGSDRLDITSYLGGMLYVGAWGANPEPVPEYADNIEARPDQIRAMLEVARPFLHLEPDQELEVLSTGRCYRPLAEPNHPIIGKVPWCLIGDNIPETGHKNWKVHGDLYINTGHNSDGVTLGPGSGKVLCEYILGLPPSATVPVVGLDNISGQQSHL
ncbi:hypothetical protein HYFRA_00000143 [Hymenoscyphus fraxineus]|uniref:FAD dependent oxidoreductase domain-containing protein n=1 Tax=Hymenoscyphus fraxineus TaxID=746836 RepID=A0A9N9L2B2_9HELO|nr:hypothetical protein HYFRA_00000143 [Hymenoscyphus fraxineus]